jgi:uncharacterized protein (TIGR01777 family)
MNKTVLIAGGTGLIGSRLSQLLVEKGYNVLHLSRRKNLQAEIPAYAWDLNQMSVDDEAITRSDIVVNLAGAGIADKPWTEERKQLIIDSRVKSNRLLLDAFQRLGHQPEVYVAASAIGYYGDSGEAWVNEESESGEGFLSKSVQIWEQPIQEAIASDLRTVALRIGLVLSTKGGALLKLLLPFYFFVGTYFGDGQQWYSWIHIDDLCRMFIQAIEDREMQGVYNAVGPTPERNKAFTRLVGEARNVPFLLFPAPVFALQLFLGEMSQTVLISTKVSSEKIEKRGFTFQFEQLGEAVQDLLARKI